MILWFYWNVNLWCALAVADETAVLGRREFFWNWVNQI